MYNKSHLSITRETSIKQEIKVLIEIKHPNIVTFVDCFSSSTHIYIVMELIEGRNLFSYFKKLWGQFSPSKRYKRSSMDIPDHLLQMFYKRHKKILRLVIGQVKEVVIVRSCILSFTCIASGSIIEISSSITSSSIPPISGQKSLILDSPNLWIVKKRPITSVALPVTWRQSSSGRKPHSH